MPTIDFALVVIAFLMSGGIWNSFIYWLYQGESMRKNFEVCDLVFIVPVAAFCFSIGVAAAYHARYVQGLG